MLNRDETTTKLFEEVEALRRKKNAVIMAHYYQIPEIQDLADFVGDSLALAQEAAKTDADIILLAGVVFMGETAKILNPKKKVLVPDFEAGCSLSDECPEDKFKAFLAKYPGHKVVTYVNSSVEVKALSDILCTSTNARKIIDSFPKDQGLIFAPDRHLGAYLNKVTGRDMVLWQGSCIVHETFDEQRIVKLQAFHPEALLIAHPECPESILKYAEHIGSTSSLLNFVQTNEASEFIVATEAGIIHQMEKACPEKTFYPAPPTSGCSCNECPFMKKNTLEKIRDCLKNENPEILIDDKLMKRALSPLERMLELS